MKTSYQVHQNHGGSKFVAPPPTFPILTNLLFMIFLTSLLLYGSQEKWNAVLEETFFVLGPESGFLL